MSASAVIDALWPGKPYPRGATWDGMGVNFALFSESAERVELCLFDASGRNEIARLALRDGLMFHDGEPVRAQDCIASLARWMRRDGMGQRIASQHQHLRGLVGRRHARRRERVAQRIGDAHATPSSRARRAASSISGAYSATASK